MVFTVSTSSIRESNPKSKLWPSPKLKSSNSQPNWLSSKRVSRQLLIKLRVWMRNCNQLSGTNKDWKRSTLSVNSNCKEQLSWLTVWAVKRADGVNWLSSSRSATKTLQEIFWSHQVWLPILAHSLPHSEPRSSTNGSTLLVKNKSPVHKITHWLQC